jgi:hypothetical protein
MTTIAVEVTLGGIIKERAEALGVEDLDMLTEAVLEAIPDACWRELVRSSVRHRVSRVLSQPRRDASHGGAQGRSRWQQTRAGGALDIPGWFIPFTGKALGEHTRDEVEALVADYRQRAVELADWAQRYGPVSRSTTAGGRLG